MKSRYRHLAAALATVLAAATIPTLPTFAALAPRAEKPAMDTFKPGNYMEFSDSKVSNGSCKRWQVKQTNSDGMLISQCNDLQYFQSVDNDFNLTKLAKSNGDVQFEFKPFMPDLAFPLEVGKKWTGEYTGTSVHESAKWKSKMQCEATAFEKVKVAAGEFDAFRIECVDHWRAMMVLSGEKRSTRWYAPKVNGMVKLVHDDPKWNYELTGYKVD